MMQSRLTTNVLLAALLLAGCASTGQRGAAALVNPPVPVIAERWQSDYATARERWIAYLSIPANGREVMDWWRHLRQIPPAYEEILTRYLWTVQDQWLNKGEFRFVVVDEDGKRIDDATRDVYEFVKLGGDLEPRFRVTTQKIEGEQRVKISPSMRANGLELRLESTGHRWINFRLPMGPDFRAAHQMLQTGVLLPPLAADGPARVVMPFRYAWENGRWDTSLGTVPDVPRPFRPDTALSFLNLPVLVSSDDPGFAPAPKRGLYARIDRNGKVWNYEAQDPGEPLGPKPA